MSQIAIAICIPADINSCHGLPGKWTVKISTVPTRVTSEKRGRSPESVDLPVAEGSMSGAKAEFLPVLNLGSLLAV